MSSTEKTVVNMLVMLDRFEIKSVKPLLLVAMHDLLQAEINGITKKMGRQLERDLFYPEGADE